jgi:uncharacterized protein YodC (DUF2158 family)
MYARNFTAVGFSQASVLFKTDTIYPQPYRHQMAETFKTGDKVRLVSGGAIMTVVYTPFPMPNFIYCSWMSDGKLHRADFASKALKLVNASYFVNCNSMPPRQA